MTARPIRGYALLVMLLLMATMGGVYLAHALNKHYGSSTQLREHREIQRGLRDAQLALIAHALIEDNTPGTLPSPSGENQVNGRSSPISFNGTPGQKPRRLPWHFLGLPAKVSGECLWYAVSPHYRNTINTGSRSAAEGTAIHPAAAGQLKFALPAAEPIIAAAVVLAPGRALPEQVGRDYSSPESCAGGSVEQFLEVGNADTLGVFADTRGNPASNDHVMPIAHTQLLRPVLRRVLNGLASEAVRQEIIRRMHASNGNLDQLRCNRARPDDLCSTHEAFDAILARTNISQLSYKRPPKPTCTGIDTGQGIDYKHPVSWLCFNNWYPHIAYDRSTLQLHASLAPHASGRCSLALDTGQIQCSD